MSRGADRDFAPRISSADLWRALRWLELRNQHRCVNLALPMGSADSCAKDLWVCGLPYEN